MPTLVPNMTLTLTSPLSSLEMILYTTRTRGGYTIQTTAPAWKFWSPAPELVQVETTLELSELQARVDLFRSRGF
jgi:hypothetical protein